MAAKKSAVAVIPIKTRSVRVPGKNFRPLLGKPLYHYMIENARRAECFDQILVDTDSDEIKRFSESQGCKIYHRPNEMTQDDVNGNDLLVYLLDELENFDLVYQLFATAPLLKASTIQSCVKLLQAQTEWDSVFTVTEETGWYWFAGLPVNYQPYVLPRSQDAQKVVKESTGLYGITREALAKYRCRIGAKPFFYKIPHEEAVDLDTEWDFSFAEGLLGKARRADK